MLEVLHPGFYASVQDLGRRRVGSLGVPASGAMDMYSGKLANLLLQNEENDALLEITFGGCQLLFKEPSLIALTGADFSAQINGTPIGLNAVIPVEKGDRIAFGKRQFGCRTYLAVKGGLRTPKMLGSRSFYEGITPDFLIRKGDQLPYTSSPSGHTASNASVKIDPDHFTSKQLDCFKGPEFDLLSPQQQQQLLSSYFTLSVDNNRMGIRLKKPLENELPSILTSAVLPGTVQLTPSGTLIVLMRDGQVTGGYPRVLQLTEEGISRLGQKVSGEVVEFRLI